MEKRGGGRGEGERGKEEEKTHCDIHTYTELDVLECCVLVTMVTTSH